MARGVPSVEELSGLMKEPARVRNLCVLAHVDHGKTSMTDSLIASNGIISARLAGKLRFMDTREDEQLRCITMKSSSISLQYIPEEPIRPSTCKQDTGIEPHLINVIDSPGHVDFCSEVASALRLCDGALALVDVVEGVRTQTVAVLRQCWVEHVTPTLILNKIDRLIVELQMEPIDAYRHLQRLIENVNAVCGTFYQEQFMSNAELLDDGYGEITTEALRDRMEAEGTLRPAFNFSPALGNVAFASATMSWAFRVDNFAQIIASKLGMKTEGLAQAMWPADGKDAFFNPKTKTVIRKDESGRLKPLFVQFILDQVWAVYNSVMIEDDAAKTEKIVSSLQLDVPPRELANKNREEALRCVMSRWLPLSRAILAMTVEQLPPPTVAQGLRIQRLMARATSYPEAVSDKLSAIEQSFRVCNPGAETSLAFVSKMFANDSEGHQGEQTKFIGFSRVFAGTLRVGDEIKVLGPRYDPLKPDSVHISTVTVGSLHLMMGRDLLSVGAVPAGCVCGIGGLDRHVLKYATLCSSEVCMPLSFMAFQAMPIVRVAVEPENPQEHNRLVRGLQLLNQADPSVETRVQETGELIIVASGEMHLERCIKDLEELFTNIKIRVSPPLVQFKETLTKIGLPDGSEIKPTVAPSSSPHVAPATSVVSANRLLEVDIRAIPLPGKIRRRMVAVHGDLLEGHARFMAGEEISAKCEAAIEAIRSGFREVGGEWEDTWERVWAFGPRGVGANMIISRVEGFEHSHDWLPAKFFRVGGAFGGGEREEGWHERVREVEGSILTGFQLSVLNGPLCEEPMEGVAFVIDDIRLLGTAEEVASSTDNFGPWSGQVMSVIKEGCRSAFLAGERRLVEAMFNCQVQTQSDSLGKAYSVIGKRRGKVVDESIRDGTDTFIIEALLPVVESFGLVGDLRKQTSGAATCQLSLAGWELMESDPFWVPSTEDELEDADQSDIDNARGAARRCMDIVRKRKGLPVIEKLVVAAEKQRTRSKRK